ncbi:unnamed protein product, partial [marine sediment metagenome]
MISNSTYFYAIRVKNVSAIGRNVRPIDDHYNILIPHVLYVKQKVTAAICLRGFFKKESAVKTLINFRLGCDLDLA